MRGVLIKDGWWKVAEPKDEEELRGLLGAKEIERPALRLGREYYGCACDADARSKTKAPDTVVMRIRKGLRRKYRYFGYVAGPVFIYLNKGLDASDVDFIAKRIFIHNDGTSPFLLVDDFQNVAYEETDP